MEYRFETEKRNYEHLASGRVLLNAPGTTAFPVRLASELAQRCFRLLKHKSVSGPYTLYDPCCGSGYLLAALGFMHAETIRGIIASDIDADKLEIAKQNLSLLTPEGMAQRIARLRELLDQYGKPSHREALESARLLQEVIARSRPDRIDCFRADITAFAEAGRCQGVNLVIADLPYGNLVSWTSGSADPAASFFDSVRAFTDPQSCVVAVVADKSQTLRHPAFKRVQYGKIGKRHFGLFEPMP
ncbi:hypothetical protein [Paenibacillus humicola]|uniref:hypothetical protein n=1 Tax=Paenibacillus humicola TaxID=3110540 RepID=UPI00237BCE3B|nr:hypothetical protein [Paenibacillus humicola]